MNLEQAKKQLLKNPGIAAFYNYKPPKRGHCQELSQAWSAISKNVKELRTQANWTQEDLAVKCGLHQSAITRLEAANELYYHPPSLVTLSKVAHAFGVSVKHLLGWPQPIEIKGKRNV